MTQDPAGALLNSLQGCYVEQVRKVAELCGFEAVNEYAIYQLDPVSKQRIGPEILHAKEGTGDCCYRQCCGSCRGLTADIYVMGNNQLLATYSKSQGLSWCGCGMCKAKASVSTFGPEQKTIDVDSPSGCPGCTTLGFTIGNFEYSGPKSLCAQCPCFTYSFGMKDAKTGAQEGQLVKMKQGCGDLVYKTNKFTVVFPSNATPEDKVTMLASVLHSDFNFFERKRGRRLRRS